MCGTGCSWVKKNGATDDLLVPFNRLIVIVERGDLAEYSIGSTSQPHYPVWSGIGMIRYISNGIDIAKVFDITLYCWYCI